MSPPARLSCALPTNSQTRCVAGSSSRTSSLGVNFSWLESWEEHDSFSPLGVLGLIIHTCPGGVFDAEVLSPGLSNNIVRSLCNCFDLNSH